MTTLMQDTLGRTTVRARLITLGVVLAALLAVVAVIAITGFSSVKSAYNADQIPGTNRDVAAAAYEGWLTADDQTNMFGALAALHDAAEANLMGTTWKQVLTGRAQASSNLAAMLKTPLSPDARALTNQLVKDLAVYNAFTDDMYKLVSGLANVTSPKLIATETGLAIKYITVNNATISNKVQSDFNRLRTQLGDEENAIGAKIPATTNSRLTLVDRHRHHRAGPCRADHLPDHPLDHATA